MLSSRLGELLDGGEDGGLPVELGGISCVQVNSNANEHPLDSLLGSSVHHLGLDLAWEQCEQRSKGGGEG